MLEGNEEARRGRRLEEQVVTERSRHKKEQNGTMSTDWGRCSHSFKLGERVS